MNRSNFRLKRILDIEDLFFRLAGGQTHWRDKERAMKEVSKNNNRPSATKTSTYDALWPEM